MFAYRVANLLTSASLLGLFVTNAGAAPAGESCPVSYMTPTVYTGLVEAPGTTYPYTNTLSMLQISFPITTATTTGTWTYDGTTSTYTETMTRTVAPSLYTGC